MYPLGNKARQLVDKTFDKMHYLGHLKFTSKHTQFSFTFFVVWKLNAEGKRKGRVVVDIQKLNDIVFLDSYPPPLQSEIIANVQGYTNIAVLDAAFFFYQWPLYPDHRFMFTVVTQFGQAIFQVPIMQYINLVAYVQQNVNNILREVRAWARAYVNNIICGASSSSDLPEKLHILFDIFLVYNISIKPTKSFFNHSDVGLLGQPINCLGIITLEEKVRAIKQLTYPKILSALKYCLELISYLRNYIHFYAQLATPL